MLLERIMVPAVFQEMSVLSREINALNLSQGIPEALNDANINRAISENLSAGWQYSPFQGDESLRSAIAADYDHFFDPCAEIVVTSGCTESLLIALLAARGRFGRSVTFLEPFYSYYPGLASLAELDVKTIRLEQSVGAYTLNLDDVEEALAGGFRILLLNSPHNPTGWVLGVDQARRLANLVQQYDGLVIVDEVYKRFVYTENGEIDLYKDPLLQGRCLVACSVSKTFAASGMRIGWLAGPPEIIKRAIAAHTHISNCHPLVVQHAVARLFSVNDREWLVQTRDHYRRKRDSLLAAIVRCGFCCIAPQGGHFILADYAGVKGDCGSREFALWFARTAGVVTLPIEDFYGGNAPKLVRWSFAVPTAVVDDVRDRLERVLK